jgi:hypothetical protein
VVDDDEDGGVAVGGEASGGPTLWVPAHI